MTLSIVPKEQWTKKILLTYVKAIIYLNKGVSESRVLWKHYKEGLRHHLGRKAPETPEQDRSPTSTPSTLIAQDRISENEVLDTLDDEDSDVLDDTETADEGSDCGDDYNDESMTAKTSSESGGWIMAYITWLRNTVKTHRAVNKLISFAKLKTYRRITEQIEQKIEIKLCSPPSTTMEDWKDTIRTLFTRKALPHAEHLITKLDYLAKYHPPSQRSKPKMQTPKMQTLSFHSLESLWAESFSGARHGESQFAIKYRLVNIATRQPRQQLTNINQLSQKPSLNNKVIIEASRQCCVSCYCTLEQYNLLFGRGKSNRIFKTALPLGCTLSDAEKIVEALQNEVRERFKMSEEKIEERYQNAQTASPAYSSDAHSELDWDPENDMRVVGSAMVELGKT